MTLKSALITGGNGNFGHLLADHFENIAIHVISYDISVPERTVASRNTIVGDIRGSEKLRSLSEKERPDAVVHLAGLLSGSSELELIAFWEVNATASVNLIQIGEQYDVGPLVFSSTLASYGPDVPTELPAETTQ